jgi:glycosyltransferase involved in cell wall biosynthesis
VKIPVSILIVARNEEKDLPGCLESVHWSDDIHVYDGYSSDKTATIAEQFGASITRKPVLDSTVFFGGNESEYRNWGLRNISYQHDWVLQIDADERVSQPLATEIREVLEASPSYVAFRIQRRDYYLDTWLRHVQATRYYIRLFRPISIRYERLVHPVARVDGAVGQLNGHFDHYPFSKGIGNWFERHCSYSTFEAKQIYENQTSQKSFSVIQAVTNRDFTVRRVYQKALFYRLPLRPLLKFLILYFLKRGFLDGKAGLTYALLQSSYEYMIALKVAELKRQSLSPRI